MLFMCREILEEEREQAQTMLKHEKRKIASSWGYADEPPPKVSVHMLQKRGDIEIKNVYCKIYFSDKMPANWSTKVFFLTSVISFVRCILNQKYNIMELPPTPLKIRLGEFAKICLKNHFLFVI